MDIIKVNEQTAVMAITVEAIAKNTFGMLTPYGYKKVSVVDGISTIIGNLETPEFIKGTVFNLKRFSLKGKTFSTLTKQFKANYTRRLTQVKPRLESKHLTTVSHDLYKTTTHPILDGEFHIEGGVVIAWVHEDTVVIFNGSTRGTFGGREVIKLPITVKSNEIHMIPWLMNQCICSYIF